MKTLLYAFGAPTDPSEPPTRPSEPYPETLRLLDEIVTDFIIETCHNAVAVATYSGRQKLKMDDFLWVLRKDTAKLGRVKRALWKEKQMKQSRRIFDASAMGGPQGGKGPDGLGVGELSTLAEEGGEVGTRKGVGRGRGRKRKSEQIANDGEEDEGVEKTKAKKKKKVKEEKVLSAR